MTEEVEFEAIPQAEFVKEPENLTADQLKVKIYELKKHYDKLKQYTIDLQAKHLRTQVRAKRLIEDQ